MSCSEVAAVCSMICCGMTVTERGVSTRGATKVGSLGSRLMRWPCTSTALRVVASWVMSVASLGAEATGASSAARTGEAHSMPAALEANRSALRAEERASDMGEEPVGYF
ncbi:hypothetical protein D3C85_676840 [compost metagenome]